LLERDRAQQRDLADRLAGAEPADLVTVVDHGHAAGLDDVEVVAGVTLPEHIGLRRHPRPAQAQRQALHGRHGQQPEHRDPSQQHDPVLRTPMSASIARSAARAVVAMHRSFHTERGFVELNMCPCGSCTQTSNLKLKFVAHVGEVATQTIRRRKKLVGMDVIYVHRLLKNAVDVPEYLLVSDDLFRSGGTAASDLGMREVPPDLEGIGRVVTFFVDIADIADMAPLPALPDPSWPRRLGSTLGMVGRGLPHVLPRRRPRTLTAAG